MKPTVTRDSKSRTGPLAGAGVVIGGIVVLAAALFLRQGKDPTSAGNARGASLNRGEPPTHQGELSDKGVNRDKVTEVDADHPASKSLSRKAIAWIATLKEFSQLPWGVLEAREYVLKALWHLERMLSLDPEKVLSLIRQAGTKAGSSRFESLLILVAGCHPQGKSYLLKQLERAGFSLSERSIAALNALFYSAFKSRGTDPPWAHWALRISSVDSDVSLLSDNESMWTGPYRASWKSSEIGITKRLGRETRSIVLQAMREGPPEQRALLFGILADWEIRDDAVRKEVLKNLEASTNSYEALAALAYLASNGTREDAGGAVQLLYRPSVGMKTRLGAIGVIARLGMTQRSAVLEPLYHTINGDAALTMEEARSLKLEIVRTLSGGRDSGPSLLEEAKNIKVRVGDGGGLRVSPFLFSVALQDADQAVQVEAMVACLSRDRNLLAGFAGDGSARVRLSFLQAAARIQPDPDVETSVRGLLRDPENQVRVAAQNALLLMIANENRR